MEGAFDGVPIVVMSLNRVCVGGLCMYVLRIYFVI